MKIFKMTGIYKIIKKLLFSAIFIASPVFLYLLIDDIYPFFSSYIILLRILVWTIIILIPTFSLCYGIWGNRSLKEYSKYCPIKKIKSTFYFYLLSLLWLFSIEYLCYINNKDIFSINDEYYEYEMKDELNTINIRLDYNSNYYHKYSQLLSSIERNKQYTYTERKEDLYLCIQTDTIWLIPNALPRSGGGMGAEFEESKYDEYIDVGIRLFGERGKAIRECGSKIILDNLKHRDSIAGIEIFNLTLDKVKFYKERSLQIRNALDNKKKLGLSFSSFITYNIFNKGNIINHKSKMINLIVLLQIVITTFVSGYIYKQAYKILDGE